MKLVFRYRVKSLTGLLNRQARADNFVWNYSDCGALPDSRPKNIAELGIRDWTCSDCGVVHDRDLNAAKNILRRGRATLVVGIPAL